MGRGRAASKRRIPVAEGVGIPEGSTPEALGRAEGGPAGCLDRGTAEEDDPVTWETPVRPVGRSGQRRTGDPLRRAAGGKRTGGRPRGEATAHRNDACPTGKARSREDRRRGEAAGESEGRIRAKKVGNGRWLPDPVEQRRPVLRQNFRRET